MYRFEKADTVAEALADTLTWARKLLPLYNPVSFFIQSLYSIPRYYAQQAYPSLPRLEQLLEEKLATRIETIYEPDIANREVREKTTIIGITKDSTALSILKAIHIVYKLSQSWSLNKYFNVEDEFKKYIEMYKNKLSIAVKKGYKDSDRDIQIIETLSHMDCERGYDLAEQPDIEVYADRVFITLKNIQKAMANAKNVMLVWVVMFIYYYVSIIMYTLWNTCQEENFAPEL